MPNSQTLHLLGLPIVPFAIALFPISGPSRPNSLLVCLPLLLLVNSGLLSRNYENLPLLFPLSLILVVLSTLILPRLTFLMISSAAVSIHLVQFCLLLILVLLHLFVLLIFSALKNKFFNFSLISLPIPSLVLMPFLLAC